ncbi:MAG: hypothetical protein EXX96DRAFT_42414 [Benjaminiella poitrasii]|nr:MAG: hypothetical protein EXX96DRAFT_42414 [Benjaminiella poitrasii]
MNLFTDDKEDVQTVYLFILDMHTKNVFMFNKDRTKQYSKEDCALKFWSLDFETFFFGMMSTFFFIAQTCKDDYFKIKLNIRFLVTKHGIFVMDSANCEFAAKATYSKLFNDCLKLALDYGF